MIFIITIYRAKRGKELKRVSLAVRLAWMRVIARVILTQIDIP
jgi:hypothetical protein